MKEFENHPYIMQAVIRYGGIFNGKSERRNFSGARVFEGIPQRILVQQFESRYLSNQERRDRIKDLSLQIKELQLYDGVN
jgi:anthranilate/para-aminobenzoate synthase component II